MTLTSKRKKAMFSHAEELETRFTWSEKDAISTGGCATVYVEQTSSRLKVQVTKLCDRYNIELLVSKQYDWRNHQVAGYLYDGNVYSTYGKWVGTFKPWNNVNATCEVVLNYEMKSGRFISGDVEVPFQLPSDVNPGDLFLGVRVHHGGAVKLLD